MTVTADVRPKDPSRVARGVKGMRSRWGEAPRSIRLDSLPPSVALAVRALVDAASAANEKADPIVNETSTGTAAEVQRASADVSEP